MQNIQKQGGVNRWKASVLFIVGLLCLVQVGARAQTIVTIGYLGEGFTTDTHSGLNAFIDTGTFGAATYGINAPSAIDPTGQGGNALIITPISDPVIHFNDLLVANLSTTDTFSSVTLRLPQYPVGDPRRTQLGFVQTTTTGVGGNGLNFTVGFADPVGSYSGDYLPYVGLPIYSTLHFYNAGLIAPTQVGIMDFFAAYPAGQAGAAYYMDIVAGVLSSSTPNTTFFNTSSNPEGGIRLASTSAPEPASLVFLTIGSSLIIVKRRRNS